MENASKALIIAGAILVSILIVGLGVIIYNNVSGIASGTNLDSQEITAHNSPFEGYFGDYVSGSNVRALITQVQANNSAAQRNGEDVGNVITLLFGKTGETVLKSSDIKTGKMYYVQYPEDSSSYTYSDADDIASFWSNGYIKTIRIYENTGSSSD